MIIKLNFASNFNLITSIKFGVVSLFPQMGAAMLVFSLVFVITLTTSASKVHACFNP